MSLSAAATTTPWPTPPSLTRLETPFGTLEVRETGYVYESYLTFDGKKVEPDISGLINITYAYRLNEARVVLIAVNSGSPACLVTYRWMTIRKGGYTLTEPFGSCSQDISVVTRGDRFVLRTPNKDKAGAIDTWVYDGHSVHRR
jgi:hypothetical protein